MRFRWLLWVLTAVFLWVVIRSFNELENLTQTLARGQWQWVIAAIMLQFVYFALYALLHYASFDIVEARAPFRDLFPLAYAAIFINSAAPSGGTASAALFIEDLRRRGYSPTRAATGNLLVIVIDYSAFCVILLAGLAALFYYRILQPYEIIAALIMFGFVAVMLATLTIGLWQPLLLYRVFGLVERLVNAMGGWFQRPELLPAEWGERSAEEFIDGAQSVVSRNLKVAQAFLIALVMHSVNVLILACVFWAFGVPPTLGKVLAGYSMTFLFLVVSPTPNGIGIVETLLPVIYTSLGLPAAEATVISFAFRGITFWLPLLIGFVLLRQAKMFSHSEQSVAEAGQVRITAVLTALMGIINVISGSTPALAARLEWLVYFSPLTVSHGGHLTSVMIGFALLLLATRLWRRKRNAFWITLSLLVLSVVIHLGKGLDYEVATLAAVFALFLFSQRSHFYAVSDPPSLAHGLRVLIAALLFTLAYGTVGFYLLDRHFALKYSLDAALSQTVLMFTQAGRTGLQPITEFGSFFGGSLYVIGPITLGYGLLSALQPMVSRLPAGEAEHRRARSLLEHYGQSALAQLTLLPDKLYHFTPGGSLIAYIIHRRIAVALGDPIGPPEDAFNAIQSFQEFGAQNDWQIAFFQTQPDLTHHYKSAGLDSICIGQEALLDLKSFVPSPAILTLGNGQRAVFHQPPVNDVLFNELQVISDEWLTQVNGTEKRFAFGWFDENHVRSSPIFAVHIEDGSIVAFASLIQSYQRNEVGVDLIRRRGGVDVQVVHFLLLSIAQWAKHEGYDTLNLGMHLLPVDREADTTAIAREEAANKDQNNAVHAENMVDPNLATILHTIAQHYTQFYNFSGLNEFEQKFRPHWSPRHLIYARVTSLPAIAIALQRAMSGDNGAMLDAMRDAMERIRNRRKVQLLRHEN